MLRSLSAIALLLTSLLPASAQADEATFVLRFVLAEAEGEPVVDEAWLDAQVEKANAIFAPAEIAFVRGETERAPLRADLITRAHRHALSPRVRAEVINVFVVRSMADVDIDGRFIRGVHWRSRRGCDQRSGCQRHYCILSSIAGVHVLAHELGHFFGNPHSDTPGNIMSYTSAPGLPFFDARQLRRIARFRRRFVSSGELKQQPPR